MDTSRIKSLAKKQGKTLSYICGLIGRKVYYLNDISKNNAEMPDEYLKILAENLGTSVAYLKGETDDPYITLNDRLFPEIATDLQKKQLDDKNINIPEFGQTLLFFFENCDAPGQLRIIQLAMNEYDRTQKEKTNPPKDSAIG
jgi:transcriptional regulator with XRE-family HTH domain